MRTLRRAFIGRATVLLALLTAGTVAAEATASACRTDGAALSPTPSETTGRPNLILIVTDDQRADTLWAMPAVRDLLAGHGVTFSNAFATTPLCCPSRASLLTGRYSRNTGVYANHPPNGGATAFDDRSTLATWLQDAGYHTGLVGKYLNDYSALGPAYIPPGWDEWTALADQLMVRYYDYTLNENGRMVHYGTDRSDYSTTVLADRATTFLSEAEEPFFLHFDPVAPHLPATPANQDRGAFPFLFPHDPPSLDENLSDKPWWPEYSDRTSSSPERVADMRRAMFQSLRAVDRAVSSMVCSLADRGVLDRTVIAFTSDNGYLWGEHRLTHKTWPYEESIRVPLVVRVPWLDRPVLNDRLVVNLDLPRTFAELGKARPGLKQDGRSLVPLLEGRSPPWRKAFVVEYLGQGEPPYPPPYEAVRTGRYLYVEYANGWRELYDLQEDPYQLTNRAGDSAVAAVESSLAERLHRLLAR